MTVDKRLYSSRDALIGGVCAGIADYFDIDPVIVRILTVVLTFATAGMFAFAYVLLWIIVPKTPNPARPVDVCPDAVHSETYGPVDWQAASARTDAQEGSAPAAWAAQTAAYTSTGHIPPQPPVGAPPASWGSPVGAAPVPPVPPVGGAYVPPAAATANVPPAAATANVPPYGAVPQQPGTTAPMQGRPAGVKAALLMGSVLLFCGVAALLGNFMQGVSWWEFWPLIIVIVGIVNMVVPGECGYRMTQFVDGLMLFFLGCLLLLMNIGSISWSSWSPIFRALWPLLLMMVGFFVLGGALKSPMWKLAGGLCFVAFCVVGVGWFALPGPTDTILFSLPFGREHVLYVHPWM